MKLSDFVDPELPGGDRSGRGRTGRMRLEAEKRRNTIASAAIISAILYAAPPLIVILEPDSKQITDNAFASYPQLGLSSKFVACSIFALLFMPIPSVIFHSVTIVMKAFEDGTRLDRLSLLAYFIEFGERHPFSADLVHEPADVVRFGRARLPPGPNPPQAAPEGPRSPRDSDHPGLGGSLALPGRTDRISGLVYQVVAFAGLF